jgi:hypothetical protein
VAYFPNHVSFQCVVSWQVKSHGEGLCRGWREGGGGAGPDPFEPNCRSGHLITFQPPKMAPVAYWLLVALAVAVPVYAQTPEIQRVTIEHVATPALGTFKLTWPFSVLNSTAPISVNPTVAGAGSW